MAAKQCASKQPMDLCRNQSGSKKYLETNESTVMQNLWDAAKAVPRGKFTGIQSFFRKQEKSQIHNLIFFFFNFILFLNFA